MNSKKINYNNSLNIGGVSILEIENKMKDILDKYLNTVEKFRNSKGEFNSKYIAYRPWLNLKDDSSVGLNFKFINPTVTVDSINRFNLSLLDDNDLTKVKRNVKKLETLLFLNYPANNRVTSDDGKNISSIISINNGEFNVIVNGLSPRGLKFTKIESIPGNRFKAGENKAISSYQDTFNGVTVKATHTTSIDFIANLSDEDKTMALENINRAYQDMSELPKQMYRILVDKYIRMKTSGLLKDANAYISIEDIHFNYRQNAGGGETGKSIKKETKELYLNALNELQKYTVDVDFSNASKHLKEYSGIRGQKKIVSNSKLVVVTSILRAEEKNADSIKGKLDYTDDDITNVIGFYYQLGEIGNLYIEESKGFTHFNYAYPRLALGIDSSRHGAALNICEYIAYEHRVRLKKRKINLIVSLEKLIEVSKYDIDYARFKRSIERFIEKQVKKATDVLLDSKTISSVEIPTNISAKDKNNLSEIFITFKLNYTEEVLNRTSKDLE